MIETEAYRSKVYGGLLGKCAGVRLGAPIEPTIWTYERIEKTYGDIRGYIKAYRNFAADDDVNGPMFFIRALIDHEGPMTAEAIGRTWLEYTREGIGFFWWGGYGRSTEHTAYLNMKAGRSAPVSGCAQVNGYTLAEQIGGQIFIDSWGWVSPGNPDQAAHLAQLAASVSHDRNGIYGGIFIAVCIALAFEDDDIQRIITRALEYIPQESEYTRVVQAVREFHREHPEQQQWRSARQMLEDSFGYDRYPGVCHMIPNAGVCALALCYGNGDLARTIEIAAMCGWDTDCNAGNVGAIIGVMRGPEGVAERYVRPMNDFHAASSISGALNILNLPTAATELAVMGCRLAQEKIPDPWKAGTFTDDLILDFSLYGSTAGIRSSSEYLAPVAPGELFYREHGTAVLLDRLVRGDSVRIFYKPFYRRTDFDDQRYSPTFTPTVYPGQVLQIAGSIEKMSGQRIALAPYVRDSRTGEIFNDAYRFYAEDEPFSFTYTLDEVPFAIDEVGLLATSFDSEKYLGTVTVTSLQVTGPRVFSIDFADETKEFGGLSRCSLSGGAWDLEQGSLHAITTDTFELYSGPYYSSDYLCTAELIPEFGDSHMLIVRSRGAASGYFFGLHGEAKAGLYLRDQQVIPLKEIAYQWEAGRSYTLSARCEGNRITCSIDGQELITYEAATRYPSGMAGVGKLSAGRTRFLSMSYQEITS
ncbi:MAG: ADP-ribosylglycohydrolase family protein [Spirochaetia bacterium]|nr:ADP-ribosylglycohydrolase family protein [Spirochaetia bacterium]